MVLVIMDLEPNQVYGQTRLEGLRKNINGNGSYSERGLPQLKGLGSGTSVIP